MSFTRDKQPNHDRAAAARKAKSPWRKSTMPWRENAPRHGKGKAS